MKNYLSLAGIQSKVHKKQNRMTIFCIILAVFLITGVFTMADVARKQQMDRMVAKQGNWHINVSGISENDAEAVRDMSNVRLASLFAYINEGLDEPYYFDGKSAAITGADADYDEIMSLINEGSYPQADDEIAVSDNMKELYRLNLGDTVSLTTPSGTYDYVISGFCAHDSFLSDRDACAVLLNTGAFKKLAAANGLEYQPELYIQFKQGDVRKSIDNLVEAEGWSEDQVHENAGVLGMMGDSSNSFIVGLYGVAAFLMVLVVLAGILMISGSMNTSIAQRTGYFGMLRCIGASSRQIKRLVIREALNWCKFAVPVGVVLGTLTTWGITAGLRYGIGGEWSDLPVFHISSSGILLGAAIGVLTVVLAALAPARRAAKVTPIEAISGNRNADDIKTAVNSKSGRIENAIGFTHATSKKKSLIMLTGSFALSIVLFLAFSVMIDWTNHALESNKPYTPDASVYYEDYEGDIPTSFAKKLEAVDGVKNVYGRMHVCTPVTSDKDVEKVDLISYEDHQFEWSYDDRLEGDIDRVATEPGYVMTVFEKSNPYEMGDRININGQTLTVGAVLSDSPFSSSDIPTILCSEETFRKVTGKSEYAVIDLQLEDITNDAAISQIRNSLDDGIKLSDYRETKQEANSTYYAFCLVVYAFLAMIALITVFNIINSISMSVTSRSRQYGYMRAIGMDNGQIKRMIRSESLTYAITGCIAGCVIGLPIHYLFYTKMISNYWGDAWTLPVGKLAIIVFIVLAAAWIAVYKPSKGVVGSTVVDTITGR